MENLLLVTVTKVEAQAVLNVFSEESGTKWERQFIGGRTYYALGAIADTNIFMVQSEMGTASPGGSLITIQQAIAALSPVAVIMVGLAFGIDSAKQKLGDILVSQRISQYEYHKVSLSEGETKVIPRGDRIYASPRLLDRIRSASLDWNDSTGRVIFGNILSGDRLIDNVKLSRQILQLEPDAIGGEIEGTGLYQVCEEAKVDWILVKAISDWGDGQKNDEAQPMASRNAARFVFHMLQSEPLSQKGRQSLLVSDAGLLKTELADLSQELKLIQNEKVPNDQIQSRLLRIQNLANRAYGRSDELTARILLPPTEMTDVQLLPSGVLERLEEYRSDENIAYLLIGGFGGGILGILSNWATNENYVITRFSIVLIGLFATLFILSMLWAWRIHNRALVAKNKIFSGKSERESQN